jgi:hypothetical protein
MVQRLAMLLLLSRGVRIDVHTGHIQIRAFVVRFPLHCRRSTSRTTGWSGHQAAAATFQIRLAMLLLLLRGVRIDIHIGHILFRVFVARFLLHSQAGTFENKKKRARSPSCYFAKVEEPKFPPSPPRVAAEAFSELVCHCCELLIFTRVIFEFMCSENTPRCSRRLRGGGCPRRHQFRLCRLPALRLRCSLLCFVLHWFDWSRQTATVQSSC